MDDTLALTRLEPPTSVANLPRVTPGMVIDCLRDAGVVCASDDVRRTFRWFVAMRGGEALSGVPEGVTAASLLFLCEEDDVASLLEGRPAAFAVVLLEGQELPDSLAVYRHRIIAVKGGATLFDVAFRLQALFTEILVWSVDLERISLAGGSPSALLEASEHVLKNFVFVTDDKFNVLASTTSIAPPDAFHQRIVDCGVLEFDNMREDRFRLPEGEFYSRPASELIAFSRLSMPVHLKHTYCGSVSMACSNAPDTQGLRDLFGVFMKHMRPLLASKWSREIELRHPSSVFLGRLIEGISLDDDYFKAQVKLLGLSGSDDFRLVLIDEDAEVNPLHASGVAKAALLFNKGDVQVFPFRDHILALCHAPAADAALSRRQVAADADEFVGKPYGIAVGVSSKFFDLHDLDLAYLQARMALGYKDSIAREREMAGEGGFCNVFSFEESLMYYFLDPAQKDRRFLDFVYATSPVRILHDEDVSSGTSSSSILWHYLRCERNATLVAKQLHMHRNTVLYHIEKFQSRFDLDLSNKAVREWLMTCYASLFAAASGGCLGDWGIKGGSSEHGISPTTLLGEEQTGGSYSSIQ